MDAAGRRKVLATAAAVQALVGRLLHISSLAVSNIRDFILKEPTAFSLACCFSEQPEQTLIFFALLLLLLLLMRPKETHA